MKCPKCNGSGKLPDNKAEGGSLRKLREDAGISLRTMADLTGYSHSYLCQMEGGHRTWKRSVAKRYEQAIAKHNKQMHKQYTGV